MTEIYLGVSEAILRKVVLPSLENIPNWLWMFALGEIW